MEQLLKKVVVLPNHFYFRCKRVVVKSVSLPHDHSSSQEAPAVNSF